MAKRHFFAVLGAFLLLGAGVFFVVFGVSTLAPETMLLLLILIFTGVLYVLGGLSVEIGSIEWYRFVGAGWVFMGLLVGISFPLSVLQDPSFGDAGTILAVAGIAGGLLNVLIGVDWMRGGHYLEISQWVA